jgi:pimeloyl-ACP methyl ester carboxylesterase
VPDDDLRDDRVTLGSGLALAVRRAEGARTPDAEGTRTPHAEGARTPDAEGTRTPEAEGARTPDAGRGGQAERVPFLLVHGLASNCRVWDGVAARLAAAGHDVVAVDQRGHGLSDAPTAGYDTGTCAADLADLCTALGWTGRRAPVVAGQSWGANVVLRWAARRGNGDEPGGSPTPAAIALVDGGWIALGRGFATFEECWSALAPPTFAGLTYQALVESMRARHRDWPDEGLNGTLANLVRTPDGGVRARLAHQHHRQILHSLWAQDPAEDYPTVRVPTLLLPAGSPDDPEPPGHGAGDGPLGKAAAVTELLAAVPGSRVRWYPGAHHDLHAQHPAEVAEDLLSLIAEEAPA